MIQDTIAGIATAMGEGAISIIRISGPDALSITNKLFRNKDLTMVLFMILKRIKKWMKF